MPDALYENLPHRIPDVGDEILPHRMPDARNGLQQPGKIYGLLPHRDPNYLSRRYNMNPIYNPNSIYDS